MGEAKRRKQILGEAYGTQDNSGQLAKAKRQFESKWIESTQTSRMLGLKMASEKAEKGEDETSPVETFFLTQYWLLSDWFLDFLKSFNPQTQKALLLDFVKTLREKFSSLSQNFLKFYESDSDSFDTDFLIVSFVDWIVDAMTLCFILSGEGFNEERCELQQALRVGRDFVSQLTSRSLISEEINQINEFFEKFDFEDE